MALNLPLWSLIPTLIIISSFYFLAPHLNYTVEDWVNGNLIIAVGIGIIYVAKAIYNLLNKKNG